MRVKMSLSPSLWQKLRYAADTIATATAARHTNIGSPVTEFRAPLISVLVGLLVTVTIVSPDGVSPSCDAPGTVGGAGASALLSVGSSSVGSTATCGRFGVSSGRFVKPERQAAFHNECTVASASDSMI